MDGHIAKCRAAAASARALFDRGDYDGCVNRAYYAMFDATRAYLKLRHGVDLAKIKTHAGVLTYFNRLGVQADNLPVELAKSLNKAIGRRAQADYDELSVERDAAALTLEEMAIFVEAVLKPIEEQHP